MTLEHLQPGQQLGPYRIIGQVGAGGMATVYKAYQASMDRYVALKVLPREFARSAEFRARFAQEARLIANLEHAHILPIYDFGETDGVHYFVMRLLETGTLKERIQSRPLSLHETDELFTQVADALGYAHQRGIVHRDIKPSNVLVDQHGDAFLTDFGIAKIIEGSSQFTGTGTITGTPDYMSPEQGRGEKLDQRSDIYSLGVVLYEMVTGRIPFEAETPLAVILKHMSAPLPPPSQVRPGLSPAIERVILKALAKERADRFGSCDELLKAWKTAVQAARDHGATASAVPAPTAAGAPSPPNTFTGGGAASASPSAYPVTPAAPPRARSALVPILGFGLIALCLCLAVAAGVSSLPFIAAMFDGGPAPTQEAVVLTAEGIPTIPPLGTVEFPTLPPFPTSPPFPRLTPDPAPTEAGLAAQVWAVGQAGQGEGQFNDARYLAVDGAGNIYVGEHQQGSRIQIFDAEGNFVSQWQIERDAYLTDLAVSADGTLYALMTGDVFVYRGGTGEALGTFSYSETISAITVAPNGDLYAVTFGSIVRFSAGGQRTVLTSRLREMLPGVALIPEAIAVDEQGNIYVAGVGISSLLKFPPDAGAVTEIGRQGDGGGEFFSSPSNVAVDSRGYVYSDNFTGIVMFDPDGNYYGTIPTRGVIFGLEVVSRGGVTELIWLDRNAAKLYKYQVTP